MRRRYTKKSTRFARRRSRITTKAIYALEERGEGAVSTNAIAARLGVTAASASGMVKALGELGLVVHEPAGQPDGDADPVPVGENGDRD
ncbi:MAG: metal-dependent transcriptional regulator [Solirubrobacteraceae bacterium]